MANKIALEIVSPERHVLKEEVDFVVLPAYEGERGVLPGHTHLLVQLKVGELRYKKENRTEILSLSGGFAEVHPNRVEVFAETAEMSAEIDSERARLALERAKKDLTKSASPQDLAMAEAALRRALIRLKVSEGLRKK